MLINFNEMNEIVIQHMNNGDGSVFTKMMMQPEGRIMIHRLPAGSSIGRHIQSSYSETNYVIQGRGAQFCDGIEETFSAGMCFYCPKGSSHTIKNIGEEDLVLFSIIIDR